MSEGLRVLACGGRTYNDYGFVCKTLDFLHETYEVGLLIHGNAKGADKLAGSWATSRGIPQVVFPANWEGEGKRAGYIRNTRMLYIGKPDVVVAFPGGIGTHNMVNQARSQEIALFMATPTEIDNDTTQPDSSA